MVHPLDRRGSSRSSPTAWTEIIVVEEKRAFIEAAVKEILYGKPDAPAGHGQDGPAGQRSCSRSTGNWTPT